LESTTIDTQPDSFERSLRAEPPSAWRPNAGDVLVGQLVEVSERDSGYGPYPLVVIRRERDAQLVAVHAYHAVLALQLAQARPGIGERVGIAYYGKLKGERSRGEYHGYRVSVDRDDDGVDWARYNDAPADGGPPAVTTSAPAASGLQGGMGTGDDIPFHNDGFPAYAERRAR
jgi:hypothetical protein